MQLEKDPTVWQRYSTKDAYMRALTSSGLMYEARAVLNVPGPWASCCTTCA